MEDLVILKGRVPAQLCGLLQMGELAGLEVGFPRRGLVGCVVGERGSRSLAGTVARVSALPIDGHAMNNAIDQAADELGVPNVLEYVERFRRAREKWVRRLETQGEPPKVCTRLE
ncbi:hypothetical protein FIV42_08140 [Persicimonas caeni]|uniref:Uncharacterized protein n=1 Tax=Persicimonas caeni TaxID=2292766 RepID=A0A4Y6PQU6_PERCE|nr:hypothetical protein [Persicimonas caeni]QDG50698.1 hypothetical protein FIV42_08140 [Persicimonas caeni]QED31919.1 hypothetical protein FRD00_08135 [Persicimonas caeni]